MSREECPTLLLRFLSGSRICFTSLSSFYTVMTQRRNNCCIDFINLFSLDPANQLKPSFRLPFVTLVYKYVAISYKSNFGLMNSSSPVMSDACDRQTDGH